MEVEVQQLKTILRSLVVSSPSQIDVSALMKDYYNMMGEHIQLRKFGVNNPVDLLKKYFSDCFLFHGHPENPVLTLIVPDSLKHIDRFVQKQKVSVSVKQKGKRRSISPSALKRNGKCTGTLQEALTRTNANTPRFVHHSTPVVQDKTQNKEINMGMAAINLNANKYREIDKNIFEKEIVKKITNYSNTTVNNSLNNQLSLYKNKHSDVDFEVTSANLTSSTSSSTSMQLRGLKAEIVELLSEKPEGIWCKDLLGLYRNRYHRELNFSRFGYTTVLSVVNTLEGYECRYIGDDWLLIDENAPDPAHHNPSAVSHPPRQRTPVDPDDALPFNDFEADVFPEDCMHYLDSISSLSLDGIEPGSMLEVIIGEVYSPSHFWMLRLGNEYNIAMETIMDEMNEYYNGEGRERRLMAGAVRLGHFCSSCYCGDWHRSIIVKVINSDTVKVRHIDYGTVETCAVAELRPLRREWAWLPAQAVRARLAGVRPPSASRSWPRSVATEFLNAIVNRALVAQVVAHDFQENILEVILIDTSTDDDVCIGDELIRSGHADPRTSVVTGTSEVYLHPLFAVIETGETPNFAELQAYLNAGISLQYVEDYCRHMPSSSLAVTIPAAASTPTEAYSTPLSLTPPVSRLNMTNIDENNTTQHPLERNNSFLSLTVPTYPYTSPVAQVTSSLESSTSQVSPGRTVPHYGSQRLVAPLAGKLQPCSCLRHTNNIRLSTSDCEVFALLSQVNPSAAQRFMNEAIERAKTCARPQCMCTYAPIRNVPPCAASPLPSVVPGSVYASIRPPPGFSADFN